MFDHPYSLQGVYSSILYANFYSKMQKKYLHVRYYFFTIAMAKK